MTRSVRLVALALTLLLVPTTAHAADPCAAPRGKKIDLSFKDAPLQEVFRLLAKVGGANIVIADEVKGAVTVDLRRVRWDQALCAVAHSKKLRVTLDNGIYTIAP